MSTLHPDILRFTFMTQCRASLIFDHDSQLWQAKLGSYAALGKTPRAALDDLMRWTKAKGDRP